MPIGSIANHVQREKRHLTCHPVTLGCTRSHNLVLCRGAMGDGLDVMSDSRVHDMDILAQDMQGPDIEVLLRDPALTTRQAWGVTYSEFPISLTAGMSPSSCH